MVRRRHAVPIYTDGINQIMGASESSTRPPANSSNIATIKAFTLDPAPANSFHKSRPQRTLARVAHWPIARLIAGPTFTSAGALAATKFVMAPTAHTAPPAIA